jgi:hypothetical protein
MIDVEALYREAKLPKYMRDTDSGREALGRLVALALEEAARVCEQTAWSNEATPLLGPELGSVKCAAAVRALKPS